MNKYRVAYYVCILTQELFMFLARFPVATYYNHIHTHTHTDFDGVA